MPNINHIMPKPVLVPIYWGNDYVQNPSVVNSLQQMLQDLVTGPFMNVMAQYGVRRGTVNPAIVIADPNPPSLWTWTDPNKKLVDQMTQQLIAWINAGTVPAPPSPTDVNQLYLFFPPPETKLQIYNNASDPTGNGIQAWHNEGGTNPPAPPYYYWAIVKTNDVGPITSPGFISGVSRKFSHELAEQFVDINGSYEEIGDPCNNSGYTYRGWAVQLLHSDWDTSPSNPCGCVAPDSPISLQKFLTAINFDYKHHGLRTLGTPAIDTDYIALRMQSVTGVGNVPKTGCPQ